MSGSLPSSPQQQTYTMAKLIVLAVAFAALVAFASAYTTIVTTTIDDQHIPFTQQSRECQQQLQQKQFSQCHMYLQQGQGFNEDNRSGQTQQQSQILKQCCNELQNVRQQCQCEAVKQVFQDVQQIQGQVGGAQQIRQLKQKAQNLPDKCQLQVQSCPLPSVITTTTVIDEENRQQSQQSCQQRVQGQRFQQCQMYIQQAQQSGSYGQLLMSISRQGQQYEQEMRQCCNELERVETECQCEALQEVYRQAQMQQQQQQQPWSQQQQGGRRGGQQMQGLKSVVEQLRDQCNLQVQQCRIPSAMF